MKLGRRLFLAGGVSLMATPSQSASRDDLARDVVISWHRLVLELVRHTATYSPPVAARAFGYLGITAQEALAASAPQLISLAGQVNGLTALPVADGPVDQALVLHTALAHATEVLFGNTGPMGQRAHAAMTARMGQRAADGLDDAVQERSAALGRAVAQHVLAWAAKDGGAQIENMGFPLEYLPDAIPFAWQPTSLIRQQQAPLLPHWGTVRPLAMPSGTACGIPAHPPYDPAPGSVFHQAAREVLDIAATLTAEQKLIARFWADEPMLSPTPPGHWIAILLDIAERDALSAARLVEALARLGVAQHDAFIACWQAKYAFNLLRPVTYIQRHIDPEWRPLIETPPFPEYPSGHSTQSGACATVLTALFGEDFAFDDHTHVDEGLPVRRFASFWAAAEEAAMSRLYGGIHYRFGNEAGTEQGRCVGTYAAALRMRA